MRADYANPIYARLAASAQEQWRAGFGNPPARSDSAVSASATASHNKSPKPVGQQAGVYRECGLLLTADAAGSEYVRLAQANAEALDQGERVRGLHSTEEIERVLGTGGKGGERGYVNWNSGWVDAGGAMGGLMAVVVGMARERNLGAGKEGGPGSVRFVRGKAERLIFDAVPTLGESSGEGRWRVGGCLLSPAPKTTATTTTATPKETPPHCLHASTTILATGAHTPSLLDTRLHAQARAQIMAYLPLTPAEASPLKTIPVLLNLSTGMFLIPPIWDPAAPAPAPAPSPATSPSSKGSWVLKVARHAYGYANPVTLPSPSPSPSPSPASNKIQNITTSFPHPNQHTIPPPNTTALQNFLHTTIPSLPPRPFSSSRLCYYTDTPTGDFLICRHPGYEGLVLATGGSGHAFKFLPVIGGKVVLAMEGGLGEEEEGCWGWGKGGKGLEGKSGEGRGQEEGGEGYIWWGTEDGSRSGEKGAMLGDAWGGEPSSLHP